MPLEHIYLASNNVFLHQRRDKNIILKHEIPEIKKDKDNL
jgi:hypothetical protein